MTSTRTLRAYLLIVTPATLLTGCSAKNLDLSQISQPDRSARLDAYEVFVGSWTWSATMVNASEGGRDWTGTADWKWSLDGRCLVGNLSAESAHAKFASSGVWSWHPTRKRYIWWMFNNWGYPQQGKANYDESSRTWRMDYRSVGLDGTRSYGRYVMKVVDRDTLDWRMDEWADSLHLYKKMEMVGTYKRAK